MHGKLKFLDMSSGNLTVEQLAYGSDLARIPNEQQSQHSRKSSPPTNGLNVSHDSPRLSNRKIAIFKKDSPVMAIIITALLVNFFKSARIIMHDASQFVYKKILNAVNVTKKRYQAFFVCQLTLCSWEFLH